MNIRELQDLQLNSDLDVVDLLPNTISRDEWLVMIKDKQGKSFFLVDDNNEVRSFKSLDDIAALLREVGCKRAKLFL